MEGLPLPYKEDEDVEFADLSSATTNGTHSACALERGHGA
jgi:hypothetical protein